MNGGLWKPCHKGASIRDLILVPRCIAQRHLSPGLLTIDKWLIIMQSWWCNYKPTKPLAFWNGVREAIFYGILRWRRNSFPGLFAVYSFMVAQINAVVPFFSHGENIPFCAEENNNVALSTINWVAQMTPRRGFLKYLWNWQCHFYICKTSLKVTVYFNVTRPGARFFPPFFPDPGSASWLKSLLKFNRLNHF
jgi:hypothetical protein